MVTEAGWEKKHLTPQILQNASPSSLKHYMSRNLSFEEDEARQHRTPECKTKLVMTEGGKEGMKLCQKLGEMQEN